MLRTLEIRDVLIIDRLSLGLGPGLNVLTGETGAGKSILLDALGFVLGWRGRADLVRAGAAQGEVVAVFDLEAEHPAHAVLAEAGIEAEEGEVILRRVNTADGRKTAWINDRRVTGEVLRDLSDALVELHGQHDDRGLLNPHGHRQLLDSFAGLDLSALRRAWRARAEAREALATAREALERAQVEEEYLRHAVTELDKLNPLPGEEATLDARRRLMQGAERIRADIGRAHGALSDGAEGAMRDALRWLEGASDKAEGRLDGAMAALGRALIELGEAVDGVEDALRGLDFNPAELEALEERLFAIRALARKHGVLPDDLGGFAEGLRGRLAAIDGGAAGLAKLQEAVTKADAAYTAEAAAVTQARTAAALRLDAAMAAELAPLKMERAVFTTEIAGGEAGPEGVDNVTFTVATNPGAPAGALNRIASGGELSRFLLALKVCLMGDSPGMTMIFDEIDRGVGGATADAVGRRLKSLSDRAQVLVVTHSPQVAAKGAHHWQVSKRIENGATLSSVVTLSSDERVEEIARMLAGDTVTDAAREAARALLR
ncbi:DNA repair protein RecN [Tabrizicola sp.]|uniref:DNA repair protein RecN n=1 Tax=Tabrizicola sp. TaxID=2005166 RepID=UPI003D2E2815